MFVIEDLDETHLLVDPSKVDAMRDRLDDEVRSAISVKLFASSMTLIC